MSFTITGAKGFRIEFTNGFALSVQWGPGNYCDRRYGDFDAPSRVDSWTATSAEIAVFAPSGEFVPLDGDDVAGWVTPNKVAAVMAVVSAAESCEALSAALVSLLRDETALTFSTTRVH